MKIRLINWEKVDYRLKADYFLYIDEHWGLPLKQPKVWELYFTLIYLLVIYTTFIVGFPVFLTFSNTLLWFLPFIAVLMTVFFMGADLLNMFTKWIKIPVSLYMLLLFLYFLFVSLAS